ncbi:hypothetical protein BKI52_12245 [marine bacterium AO1-C]|nr:hypothetical protein BKI52_12245 [marine bacterium AO1-C]
MKSVYKFISGLFFVLIIGYFLLPYISPKYASMVNSIISGDGGWKQYHKHSNGVMFFVKLDGDEAHIKAENLMTFDIKIDVKLASEPAYSWTTVVKPLEPKIKTYNVGYNANFKFIMDANPVPLK